MVTQRRRRFLLTLGAHHCVKVSKYTYEITTGYVLAFTALLIIQGAHFKTTKRSSMKMWRRQPYGLVIPHVRNSMTSMAYKFMQSYIHFCDNDKRAKSGKRTITLFSNKESINLKKALKTILIIYTLLFSLYFILGDRKCRIINNN